MKLIKMKVSGFRSLHDTEIDFNELTMLIGGNDTGKSSILDILNIALGNESPEKDDFCCPPGGDPVEKINMELMFSLGDDDTDAQNYSIENILRVKKVYSKANIEAYYWGERPEDERLARDFEKMTAGEQKELISQFDESALEILPNKEQRAQWLQDFADSTSLVQEWVPIPTRWEVQLPRFERYSAIDYTQPANIVLKTLRQIYDGVIFEEVQVGEEIHRQYIPTLRELHDEIDTKIQEKVNELLGYIQRYNKKIKNIEFDPSIDFSGGLKAGEFQIDDGRGLHYLSKTGDGTKRRMLIATLDWDHDVTVRQIEEETSPPPIIRGYDEPDTNLDYEAQHVMYRSISGIVHAENSRIQSILCTHSPRMIDRAPAKSVRLLKLHNGATSVEQLETDSDPEVEEFLRDMAQELGLTNTLMFYERCFILVEGVTEINSIPKFYRNLYGHSMLEDGISLINTKGNGAIKEFLKLLRRNRQELTIIFVDKDTENQPEARLTKKILQEAGFNREFISKRIIYSGTVEFEDSFTDGVICRCLNLEWPKIEGKGEWTLDDVSQIREIKRKISDGIKKAVWDNTSEGTMKWNKPVFGKALARHCDVVEYPTEITSLFDTVRIIAGVEST